jgi:hypothetical protein
LQNARTFQQLDVCAAAIAAATGDLQMQALSIAPCTLPPECETLRAEVRAFLTETLADYSVQMRVRNWTGADAGFSLAICTFTWLIPPP